MNKITLAIPTYNTSQYFLDCILYAIEDDFIEEIVVNDDFSSYDHCLNLLNTVKKINSTKIKLYRNSQNLGAFKNKIATVNKCNSDWVYLLDSDNYPFKETYEILKSLDQTDKTICYSPEKLFCKRDSENFYSVISNYNFPYELIGIRESKDAITKNIQWFDWLLNTGNYFFNKNFYLKSLSEGIESYSSFKLEADTAGAFYFLIKNGGKIKVVNGLRHNHRLRDDSNWCSFGDDSSLSVEFFKNAIMKLND